MRPVFRRGVCVLPKEVDVVVARLPVFVISATLYSTLFILPDAVAAVAATTFQTSSIRSVTTLHRNLSITFRRPPA